MYVYKTSHISFKTKEKKNNKTRNVYLKLEEWTSVD